ncbi:MAG: hypothetical protein K6F56_07000 [Oscillospiraceae bacterium]|nr:hypothetical protein [Oscillospiraceae bacterium]
MKKFLLGILLKVLLAGLGLFVVTFTVYMFNLDMKLMTLIAPLLEKWYDHQEHKQYI